jgi:arylsulfatase A-like enzyme
MLRSAAARRCVAALAAAVTLPVALTACLSQAAAPPPKPVPTDGRPNIVFILTDDLSMNLIPYMPHVRALAEAGTSFSNYYVVDSLCCPSRAAIFTGQYPHNDHVLSNHAPEGGFTSFTQHGDAAKSFGVALHNAGYFTGFMGKYLNEYKATDPPQPGWDVWDVAGNAYSEYNYALNENGSVHTYGTSPTDYLTNVLAGKAVNFVNRARYTGRPFALEVATFAPHKPATPAPIDSHSFPTLQVPRTPAFGVAPKHALPWLAKLPPLDAKDLADINSFYRLRVESVLAVDRLIGQLERVLAATHRLANTYFVFSSDNGFHMGEHNMRPGKQTAFDTDIRVPLIVAGPGVPAGRTVDAMTSSIDLAPTFLQIAHAQPTDEPDGISLLNLWHGAAPPADWQSAILVEHHGPVQTKNDPDVQSYFAGDPPSYEAIRTPSYLYAEYDTGEREYYDLRTDPYENDNSYSSLSADQQQHLHEQLAALANCRGTAECQSAATPAGV